MLDSATCSFFISHCNCKSFLFPFFVISYCFDLTAVNPCTSSANWGICLRSIWLWLGGNWLWLRSYWVWFRGNWLWLRDNVNGLWLRGNWLWLRDNGLWLRGYWAWLRGNWLWL